ncbi:hypothetical protein OS493_037030 [Desmophyllum pertusum]|uniref:Uncharacterized protein n=1 Tax=Desmophyllum pertusum TaxID=174260 RepID=A0A9W9Y778_9CNID|nr:hypothetical protein OS493_037030 [Desmophyllum pertusum]
MCSTKLLVALVILGHFQATAKGASVQVTNDAVSSCSSSNLCKNGGQCRTKTDTKGISYYCCLCKEGFYGKNCEQKGCEDNKTDCPQWAKQGECQKNPCYMNTECMKSCNSCGMCKDCHQSCPAWAERGECSKNSRWMKPNCKFSCKQCC